MPTTPVGLNDPHLQKTILGLRATDNVTNWYYLSREYLSLTFVIGGAISVYLLWPVWWLVLPVTLFAIAWVGAIQHRLATLTHEAAHYTLFRNRLLNELVSEWCCMFPMLGTTHTYRVQHLGHHQYPNDPNRDPDWLQLHRSGHRFEFPLSPWGFWWHAFFKQLLWPPALIRYVLVRATYVVDLPGSPYSMARRTARGLRITLLLATLTLLGLLACAVMRDEAVWLTGVPVLWLSVTAMLCLLPTRYFAQFRIKPDIPPRVQSLLRWTFNTLAWSSIAGLTLLTGQPVWLFYFVLWLVPLGTSFAFYMVLRQVVQHGNADRERFTNTRVYLLHPLLRYAVFPLGNDYHLPHHLFPMVPHYRLAKLHEMLLGTSPYDIKVQVVQRYFGAQTAPDEPPSVMTLLTTDSGLQHGQRDTATARMP